MNDQIVFDIVVDDGALEPSLRRVTQKVDKHSKDVEKKLRPGISNAFNREFSLVEARAGITSRNLESRFKTLGSSVAAALGIGAGIGLAGLVQGITTALNVSIERAYEAEKANRLLSAAATQAGMSYQFLAEKANLYATEAGSSQTTASQATAQLARLASASGKNIDELRTAILDLSSARGMQQEQISTLINALVTGSSDEPLNAVGLADPGALAKQYADSIGKSVTALTRQEQVLSRVVPLLKDAELLTGANADRLQSFAGQTETARARLDDLWSGIGTGITQSLEFRDALKFINEELVGLTSNIGTIQQRLAKGMTPEQIAAEEIGKQAGNAAVLDVFKSLPIPGFDKFFSPEFLQDLFNVPAQAMENVQRRFQDMVDQVKAEARILERQNQQADTQRIKLNDAAYLERQKTIADAQKKSLEQQFKDLNDLSLGQKKELLNNFLSSGALFEPDEMKRASSSISKAIKTEIEAAKKLVSDYGKELKDQTREIFSQSGADNPFVKIFTEGEIAIEKTRVATRGLSEDLQKTILDFQRQNNAMTLFQQRVDNAFQAQDLRSRAEELRNPFNKEQSDERRARWERAFLHDNPNYLFLKQREFDARRQDTRDPISLGFTSFDDFIKKDMKWRSEQLFDSPESRMRNRLDQQLALADQLARGGNDRQRAIVDAQILAIGRQVNASDLTSAQREGLATVFERAAVEKEIAEQTAIKQREEQKKLQEQMLKELEKLNGKAEKEGTAGIKQSLEITVKDETSAGVETKQPTPELSAAYYSGQVQFGGWFGNSN